MSQKDLNTILGLNPDKGFNGIFTPKREGRYPDQLSVALSSYSVSGIYTTLQQKVGNNAFSNLLRSSAPFKEANKKISDEELKQKTDEEYFKHKNYKIFLDAVADSEVGYSKYLESLTPTSSGSSSSSSGAPTATKSRSQREGEIEGEVQKNNL